MIGTIQVTGDHRYDDLRQAGLKVIPLDDQRRATFRSAEIRIREENEDNIAAFTDRLGIGRSHRKCPFPDSPSPRQRLQAALANQLLASR